MLDTRPHPSGCKCETCRPLLGWSTTPARVDLAAYDLALARRVRAEDRLRSQRKRHAQRLAELKAKLDEAEKRHAQELAATQTVSERLLKENLELLSKVHRYAWRLNLTEEPSKHARAFLERAIQIAINEGKDVKP